MHHLVTSYNDISSQGGTGECIMPASTVKKGLTYCHTGVLVCCFWSATYLSPVLILHQPQWSLRSVNQKLLSVPRCNSSFGQRSFSYCAPKIWNDIPLSLWQSPSLDSFKRNLKTYYFANNWPPGDCLQRLWVDTLDIVCFTIHTYIHTYKWKD